MREKPGVPTTHEVTAALFRCTCLKAFQSALRADVIRGEVACDHPSLTCTVFDPMVHPCKDNKAIHAAVFFMLSTSLKKRRKTAQRYIDATLSLKRPQKGTQPPSIRLFVCYLHGSVGIIIGSSHR